MIDYDQRSAIPRCPFSAHTHAQGIMRCDSALSVFSPHTRAGDFAVMTNNLMCACVRLRTWVLHGYRLQRAPHPRVCVSAHMIAVVLRFRPECTRAQALCA